MAQLAIKGHATRGKEVIEILEMLGSSELYPYNGDDDTAIYTTNGLYIVAHDTAIYSTNGRYVVTHKVDDIKTSGFIVFTLEEFLEKFPYKLGDKVIYEDKRREITKMVWEEQTNTVAYKLDDKLYCNVVNELQPYKEEDMLERIVDITRESDGRYRLKVNDQFDIEGDEGEYYIIPKKSKYPKTHVECCEILYPNENFQTVAQPVKGHEGKKLFAFQKLLICRDAYWKIAGDWKPNWVEDDGGYRYCIRNESNKIAFFNEWLGKNYILSFPSAEMRDAFYENFKELIVLVKEFL